MKLILVPRIIANVIQLVFSILLAVLSLHLIHLALGYILNSFQVESPVDEIFNALWLLTVALAVFDLAGIIFDEITWRDAQKELREFKWQFTKFLIVIITALLIETLVVFFRVAKKDVTQLIYPALAIGAVCLLIVALAFYIKHGIPECDKESDDALYTLQKKYVRGEIDKEIFNEKMEALSQRSGLGKPR